VDKHSKLGVNPSGSRAATQTNIEFIKEEAFSGTSSDMSVSFLPPLVRAALAALTADVPTREDDEVEVEVEVEVVVEELFLLLDEGVDPTFDTRG
jgi:hypothetical protein